MLILNTDPNYPARFRKCEQTRNLGRNYIGRFRYLSADIEKIHH